MDIEKNNVQFPELCKTQCFLNGQQNLTFVPKWETRSHNSLFDSQSSVNVEKLSPDQAKQSNICARTGNKVSKQSILYKLNFKGLITF